MRFVFDGRAPLLRSERHKLLLQVKKNFLCHASGSEQPFVRERKKDGNLGADFVFFLPTIRKLADSFPVERHVFLPSIARDFLDINLHKGRKGIYRFTLG